MPLFTAHPEIAALAAGLIAVPIAIHLLTRRRYRETPWAAMAFLNVAMENSRRRTRLENWLLLLLRAAAVAVAGLAIARPAVRAASASWIGSQSADHIIIIDDSFSMMAVDDAGRTAFDDARDAATQFVTAAAPSDRFMIVSTSAATPAALSQMHAREQALSVINDLECGYGTADLPAIIKEAQSAHRQMSDAPVPPSVSVFSDFARGAVTLDSSRQNDETAALPDRTQLLVVGGDRADNLAVTGLQNSGSTPTAGIAFPMSVDLSNFGSVPTDLQRMEILLDQRVVANVEFTSIGPGDTMRRNTSLPPLSAGSHIVTARIVDHRDTLPDDDQRTAAIEVPDSVPVLLVDADTVSSGTAGGAFYMAAALAPQSIDAGQPARTSFSVRRVSESELSPEAFDDYRLVILADVNRPNPIDLQRLTQYVADGGAVLICLGPNCSNATIDSLSAKVDIDNGTLTLLSATTLLNQAGAVLPATSRLVAVESGHPVLTAFDGRSGGLFNTPIERHHTLVFNDTIPAFRTILKYSDGDPALVEYSAGRGRVMVWTTSPDMSWHTLPARPDFVPLMVNITSYAASGAAQASNTEIGRMIDLPVSQRQSSQVHEILRPDGGVEQVAPLERGEARAARWRLRYDHTDLPGAYRIRSATSEIVAAVHTIPQESDLQVMDDAAIVRTFGPAARLIPIDDSLWHRGTSTGGSEISRTLLILLVGLLLAESLVAATFGGKP